VQLTQVGHAGAVVAHDDVTLLMDPWLSGTAFNDSWSPWPEPALPDTLLAQVTHLWISHEHPDHLSIPTLRGMSPERRAAVTVLYQRHWQPAVVAFLRTLGFRRVVELVHGVPTALGRSVSATLHQVGHEDSALVVRGGGRTLVNLNDCKPTPRVLRRLTAAVGPVDVLLDQFSIAGWPGNPDDRSRHERVAAGALATFATHVEAFRPRCVVPFASYARFCHEENAWMNAVANPVRTAVEAVGRDRAAVLYPGDTWDVAQPWPGTDEALRRYADAEAAKQEAPLTHHASEPTDAVLDAADEWMGSIVGSYHRPLRSRIPPVGFAVDDGDTSFVVDVAAGRVDRHAPLPATVVHCSSQAARTTFGQRWGVPTLLISGRFTLEGPEAPFRRWKQLGSAYSTGVTARGLGRTVLNRRMAGVVWRRKQDLAAEVVGRLA
jgi:UDP-MurNAc hydroxylase